MRIPAVAVAVLLALPVTSGAAPRPHLTDPVGDVLPVVSPGYDVVSAVFGTSGRTERIGGKTVYTPAALVVTVTYAGAVPPDPYGAQAVRFDAPGCKNVYLAQAAGRTFGRGDCARDGFHVTSASAGRTVTLRVSFKQVGEKHLYRGAVLTGLRTYTAVGEPVWGNESGDQMDAFGLGPLDSTRMRATYRIA